ATSGASSMEHVIWEIVDNTGKHYDPMLVALFLDIIEENKSIDIPHKVLSAAKEKIRQKNYSMM
ncbi:MAG: hypothetical protein SVW57_14970, partial [Thermodesulfobacteriota bacterium]|nr:hypothetical protein [Thermodesulfobacteriota bacterium]